MLTAPMVRADTRIASNVRRVESSLTVEPLCGYLVRKVEPTLADHRPNVIAIPAWRHSFIQLGFLKGIYGQSDRNSRKYS
jgi:hypothetical protein